MGLEFTLVGLPGKTGLLKRQDPREAAQKLAETMVEQFPENARMLEGRKQFVVLLADCPIFIWPHENRVIASSKTSVFGAGFHVHAIDLLKSAAAQCRIEWLKDSTDEAGYFSGASAAEVAEEMTRNIQQVCKQSLAIDDATEALHMDWYQQFAAGDGCRTPLGLRPLSWREAVASGASSGADIFPWPEPGFGASFRQGRALYAMWCLAPWVSVDETDCQELYDQISSDLESLIDVPGAEVPWHEWQELINLGASASAGIRQRVDSEAAARPAPGQLIGYRRSPVKYRIDSNFAMTMPGSLMGDRADGWELSDKEIYVGFSPVYAPANALMVMADGSLGSERFELDVPFANAFSRAEYDSPYDGKSFMIQGFAQAGEEGLVITMTSETSASEPRMRGILDTLEHQGPYEVRTLEAK